MRAFAQVAYLLIGVIVASFEIANTQLDVVQRANENELVPIDKLDTKNAEYTRGTDTDAKVVKKRGEIVESWLDLPMEDKEFQTGYPPLYQKNKKKNPWINWWGNKKRQSVHETTSGIRRPIRVPFNSWGGKRFDPNMYVDGYGAKREAGNIERVRWDSWGGKRAEKSTDREQRLPSIEHTDVAPSVLGVFREYQFAEGRNDEDNSDEKSAVQTKSGAMSAIFQRGDGNRNDFIYRIPFHVYNETNEDNYAYNDINDWLTSMPNKRVLIQHEKCKRGKFNPWGGKRSLKAYTFPFGKDFAVLAYSTTGKKVFLCCYLHDESK